MIDPTSPDAPTQLANRSGEMLAILMMNGFDPLHDATDLMILSIAPMAIKQCLIGDPLLDQEILMTLLRAMDLTVVEELIVGQREGEDT